ncbi:MAG TPA: hypothetical protein VKU93_10640 [Terracidiphilus sp.]|nr:hypothetical protein [Terracidiphilus sp.]
MPNYIAAAGGRQGGLPSDPQILLKKIAFVVDFCPIASLHWLLQIRAGIPARRHFVGQKMDACRNRIAGKS